MLSCLAVLSAAVPQAEPPPLTALKASYPFGPVLGSEATPDNARLFSADGAGIAILDSTELGPPSAPPVIDVVETPDCSPDALLFHRHPVSGDRSLYIAGGSLGLWRLGLCEGLFDDPPVACGAYPLERIDIVDQDFIRKRCIDLAIVEGNTGSGGDPLLFAVFAARAGTGAPLRASELHAFRLESDGTMPAYGSILCFDATTLPGLDPEAKALAIASDPGDPDSLYVALGTGGVCKVDIETSQFEARPVSSPSCPTPASEQVRDLALVRTRTQGLFLYAAMDYGRILEFRRVGGEWTCTPTLLSHPHPTRIAALETRPDHVLLAVGLHSAPGTTTDSIAPWRKDGLWWDSCLAYGLPDANATATGVDQLRLLARDTADPGSALADLVDPIPFRSYWVSLALRGEDDGKCRVYASSTDRGTEVWRVTGQGVVGARRLAGHVPVGAVANDGAFSASNPGLCFLGGDQIGAVESPGRLFRIRSPEEPGGVDFVPVEGTQSPCSTPPTANECGSPPPFPYVGSLMGACSWPDPSDPDREWFLAGNRTWSRHAVGEDCAELDCIDDPCAENVAWRKEAAPSVPFPIGWKVSRLRTNDLIGSPPTGESLEARWWQIHSASAMPAGEPETPSTPYVHAQADPRFDAGGLPLLIHGVRSSARNGYKVFRTRDIVSQATQACTGGRGGFGESLVPDFREGVTHVELEDPGPEPGQDPCLVTVRGLCDAADQAGAGARVLINSRSETFPVVRRLDGAAGAETDLRWITAVAAGFVATGPSGQSPSCVWDDTDAAGTPRYFGCPILVLHDVTETAGSDFAAPVLLRVALGPREAPPREPAGGLAWAVRTKSYGTGTEARVYAFVADARGRILVFDVSADQLYASPSPATVPYLPQTPILPTVATLDLPSEPFDGRRPNLVDLEIDGEYLYCAAARAGVAVIRISDPLRPVLVELLDTPGLAMGLALRTDEHGRTQMLAGDNNCGLRLYGRPGE